MKGNYFSQYTEDACRLPEGMRRVAYDADTQRYTFRDRSGQLYQSAPGEEYGVLKPATAAHAHRRNVTITEIPDPALRDWSRSQKSTKTFGDILPSSYITAAQESPSQPSPSERFFQAAMPKVQGVAAVVRRRATLPWPKPSSKVSRSTSLIDEKRGLLEDDAWEVVHKEELIDGRLARSKSEMRPPRYYAYK